MRQAGSKTLAALLCLGCLGCLLALPGSALPLAAPGGIADAEDLVVPPARWPALPRQAARLEQFVPAGWRLEAKGQGDLNRDGVDDAVLLLQDTDAGNVLRHPGGGEDPINTNPRMLAVVFAQPAGGYALALENHTLIPRWTNPFIDDPVQDEVPPEIHVEHGAFRIPLHHFANMGSWRMGTTTYTFRWENGHFFLIGYDDSSVMRNSGETSELSVNYPARKVKRSRGTAASDGDTVTWATLPPGPAITIEQVGDGMEFEPNLGEEGETAAAAGEGPVQSLSGRYSTHFQNQMVDGQSYESDDVVEIVPVSDKAAYIRVSLEFVNGHSCDIAGVAEAEGDRLVYRDPEPPLMEGDRACVLSLSRRGSDLLIDDDDNTCKRFCGQRGSLMGQTLPFGSRRQISYLARLKASDEYRSAVAEWEKAKLGKKGDAAAAGHPPAPAAPRAELIVKTPEPNQRPALSLTTLDQKPFSLAAQHGKWVMVLYWASWCPPCLQTLPAVSDFVRGHPDVAVIGIATMEKSREDVVHSPAVNALRFPVAWVDEKRSPSPFGGLAAIPTIHLIAPDGTWVRSWTGQCDAGDIEQQMAAGGYRGQASPGAPAKP